jgi:hypothetical protein
VGNALKHDFTEKGANDHDDDDEVYYYYYSCGSAVGIATDYGLDYQGVGVRITVGQESSPYLPDRLLGPPIQWVLGSLPPPGGGGGEAAGLESGHLPPTSAKVKKMWIYTSTPPYFFMA